MRPAKQAHRSPGIQQKLVRKVCGILGSEGLSQAGLHLAGKGRLCEDADAGPAHEEAVYRERKSIACCSAQYRGRNRLPLTNPTCPPFSVATTDKFGLVSASDGTGDGASGSSLAFKRRVGRRMRLRIGPDEHCA